MSERRCPKCGSVYTDTGARFCPKDGSMLVEIQARKPGPPGPPTPTSGSSTGVRTPLPPGKAAGLDRASTLSNQILDARYQVMKKLGEGDRKSTRLNSSHLVISYAVFCLKK